MLLAVGWSVIPAALAVARFATWPVPDLYVVTAGALVALAIAVLIPEPALVARPEPVAHEPKPATPRRPARRIGDVPVWLGIADNPNAALRPVNSLLATPHAGVVALIELANSRPTPALAGASNGFGRAERPTRERRRTAAAPAAPMEDTAPEAPAPTPLPRSRRARLRGLRHSEPATI